MDFSGKFREDRCNIAWSSRSHVTWKRRDGKLERQFFLYRSSQIENLHDNAKHTFPLSTWMTRVIESSTPLCIFDLVWLTWNYFRRARQIGLTREPVPRCGNRPCWFAFLRSFNRWIVHRWIMQICCANTPRILTCTILYIRYTIFILNYI